MTMICFTILCILSLYTFSSNAVYVPPIKAQTLEFLYKDTLFEIEVYNTNSSIGMAIHICREDSIAMKLTDIPGSEHRFSPTDTCIYAFGEFIQSHRNADVFKRITAPEDVAEYSFALERGVSEVTAAALGTSPFSTAEFDSVIATQAARHGIESVEIKDTICTQRHMHVEAEYMAAIDPVSTERSKYPGAIVILAQGQRKHSTYQGRDSIDELIQTLDLLYLHYNNRYHDDIWIFHEGDFTEELMLLVKAGRPEIRFYHLHSENWEIFPRFITTELIAKPRYSIGYKKMIRWYTIRIWEVLSTLGYTWVWRLDDDSKILSPIPYNIFAFMERNGYQYGYRNAAIESPDPVFFHDFVQSFVISHNITSTRQLMDSCNEKMSIHDFTPLNCGNMPSYYNNFYVSNITRWREPDVQALLQEIDAMGVIFHYRWNDLTTQSLAVRLFFDESTVHRFVGWGYSHFSGDPRKPVWGIAQNGYFDTDPLGTIVNYARVSEREVGEVLSTTRLLYGKQFTATILYTGRLLLCQHKHDSCLG